MLRKEIKEEEKSKRRKRKAKQTECTIVEKLSLCEETNPDQKCVLFFHIFLSANMTVVHFSSCSIYIRCALLKHTARVYMHTHTQTSHSVQFFFSSFHFCITQLVLLFEFSFLFWLSFPLVCARLVGVFIFFFFFSF